MTATRLFRPASFLSRLLHPLRPDRALPEGGPPKWIGDRHLAGQLLKDTGLSLEDLEGRPTYDESLPFFMQRQSH